MSAFVAKHWFLLLLVAAIGLTLLVPGLMHPVTDHWEPRWTIAISLFLMAWTMPTQSLITEIRRPYASLWAILLSYILVPGLAWLLGRPAPVDAQIGLILISVVPCTLSSAILWTRMAGGNEATALLTVTGTTFASWLATTGLVLLLTGTSLSLNTVEMMQDLLLSLVLPVIVGQLVRLNSICMRISDRYKWIISVVAQGFMLAIILKAGVAVGDRLQDQQAPQVLHVLLWSVGLAVTLHLISLGVGLVSCRWLGFDQGRQIAVAFSASQKTLQVSLVLYERYFKQEYPFAIMPLLFYHVGQLVLDTLIAKQLAKRMHAQVKPEPEVYEFHI